MEKLDDLKDNQIRFVVEMKIGVKDYAGCIYFDVDENGTMDSQKLFDNVGWFSLISLTSAMKQGMKLSQHPAKLNPFEIPRLFRCAKSPLYEFQTGESINK